MKIHKFYTPISCDAMKSILRFLPDLQKLRPDEVYVHSPGELITEDPLTFRMHGEYHPLVDEFKQALYKHGFVQDCDWPKFHGRALDIFNRPELMRRVTLETCVKLLTFHARKDRFIDGHFASMLAEGHLTAILIRIRGLASER